MVDLRKNLDSVCLMVCGLEEVLCVGVSNVWIKNKIFLLNDIN